MATWTFQVRFLTLRIYFLLLNLLPNLTHLLRILIGNALKIGNALGLIPIQIFCLLSVDVTSLGFDLKSGK